MESSAGSMLLAFGCLYEVLSTAYDDTGCCMFQNVLLGSSKAFFPPCVHHVQCAVTMLGHFLFCP